MKGGFIRGRLVLIVIVFTTETIVSICFNYEMKKRNEEYGLATLCVGGGMGVSVIVKNIL